MRAPVALAVLLMLLPASPAHAQEGPAPLSFEECLEIALARNPGLDVARSRVTADEARVAEADAAGRVHVESQAGYLRIQDPPTLSVLGRSLDLGRPDAFFADVGAQQVVYAGGAVKAAGRGARAGRDAAGASYETARQELALAVHRAYYGTLLARELVAVRRSSLDQLEAHLKVTRDRFEQGAATEYEVLRAEVEVANQRPLLVEAENQEAEARDRLTRLLGLDPESPVAVQGELAEAPRTGPEIRPPELGVGERPELSAAQARRTAAEATLRGARAERRPTVSWLAHVFATSPEYLVAEDSDPAVNAVAGVLVRLPLWTGGERPARIARAEAELAEARAATRDLAAEIALEVRIARRRTAEAEAVLTAQGRVIEQAEKTLEIARVRYTHGLGTQLEVTDARVALDEARVLRLRALADRAVAAAELRRALGLTLLPEGGSDEH